MVTVLAIDPGVSTGIAIALQQPTYYVDGEPGLISDWTVPIFKYSTATCTEPEQVWSFIAPPVQVVVIEQFQAQLISKYGLHTVEVVGGTMALCWKLGIEVHRQTPQQRRAYLPLARKYVRLQPGPHTDHEIDAMAQLLCYQYHLGHITERDLRSIP